MLLSQCTRFTLATPDAAITDEPPQDAVLGPEVIDVAQLDIPTDVQPDRVSLDALDVASDVDAVVPPVDVPMAEVVDVVRTDAVSDATPDAAACEPRFASDPSNCGRMGNTCVSGAQCRMCACRPSVGAGGRLPTGPSILLATAIGSDRRPYVLMNFRQDFSFAGTVINPPPMRGLFYLLAFEENGMPRWARLIGNVPDIPAPAYLSISPDNTIFFSVPYIGSVCLSSVCSNVSSTATDVDVLVGSLSPDNVALSLQRFGNSFNDVPGGLAAGMSGGFIAASTTIAPSSSDGGMLVPVSDLHVYRHGPLNLLWTRDINATSSNETAKAVAFGPDSSVTVLGTFDGNSMLGGFTPVGATRRDVFITRYNNMGMFLWTRRLGSELDDDAVNIGVDQSGDTHVLLNYTGRLQSGSMTYPNRSMGTGDVAVVVLDGMGIPRRTTTWGSTVNDVGEAIAVLPDGAELVGVTHSFPVDPGSGMTITPNLTDSYVAFYDPMGTFQWSRSFTGSANEQIRHFAVTGDRLLVSGTSTSPVLRFGTEMIDGAGNGMFLARIIF